MLFNQMNKYKFVASDFTNFIVSSFEQNSEVRCYEVKFECEVKGVLDTLVYITQEADDGYWFEINYLDDFEKNISRSELSQLEAILIVEASLYKWAHKIMRAYNSSDLSNVFHDINNNYNKYLTREHREFLMTQISLRERILTDYKCPQEITLHIKYKEPININGWVSEKDKVTFDNLDDLQAYICGKVAYDALDNAIQKKNNEILLYAVTKDGEVVWCDPIIAEQGLYPEKIKVNKDLMNMSGAMRNFSKAAEELANVLNSTDYGEIASAFEKSYPFHCDFNELTFEITEWVEGFGTEVTQLEDDQEYEPD